MILLKASNLVKRYGQRTVVSEVSFEVGHREVIGLLGRNGAGKTTTFRMIMGMVVPDGGQVLFDGFEITKLPMYKRARRGMGYLSQEPSIFQRMTVEQNLLAILETTRKSSAKRKEEAARLMEQFGLTKTRKQKALTLSGGERRKLEIARSLITNPQLILLDEPFSGVDPIAVEDLQREIRQLKDSLGKAILITDHNVQRTLEVCDRGIIIDNGKVLAAGTPRDLINNPIVRQTYLGHTFRGDEFG
ncbi:MAG TPA: LPS export ABC transporter ATP-binding protein [Phycisphaerae bacterium]|jgi:lipopolysaccharide export system ATP-binding protein|nr:LPS export ABC transporter ATP-binding protein [Phycisphaerae bacterium]